MQSHLKPGDITPDLIATLDKAGPRYTSYPTAPEWKDSFREADFAAALARADGNPAPLALYAHIPFCAELCYFCGCTVVISKSPERSKSYLTRLQREILLLTRHLKRRRSLGQLHLGGGTPTHLSPAQLRELLQMISSEFQFTADAERAIEVDPRVTTFEHVSTLRELGFNRISLGVQDFDPQVQAAVHREQSEELTRALYEECRRQGFTSINIDLMYGLPHQTPETFAKTLRTVVDMRPDRVACFGYAHVPWLKKAQTRFEKGGVLPAAPERCQLFSSAISAFTAAGYRSIGMDHFALPHDELTRALDAGTMTRSFMGYTTRPSEDLVGIGHSSISDVANCYAQNSRTLPEYELALDRGELSTCRGYNLTPDDVLRRFVILRVMSADALVFAEVEAKFGIDFKKTFRAELVELLEYAEEGLLTVTPERLDITPVGRVFVRNLAMVFDKFLRDKQSGERRFSRTV